MALLLAVSSCGSHAPAHQRMSSEELYEKGSSFLRSSEQPDSAFFYFSILADRLNPEMDRDESLLCAAALNVMGYLYFHHYGNIPYAFDALIMSKQLAEKFGDKALYAKACLNLAIANNICMDLGFAKKGNKPYVVNMTESFDKATETGNWVTILNSFANMSAEVKPDSTPPEFEERIRRFGKMQIPDSIGATEFYNNRYRTSVMIMDRDFTGALNFLHSQLNELGEVFDAPRVRAQLYYEIANVQNALERPDSAEIYLNRALAIAKNGNHFYDQTIIYKALHDLSLQNGDTAAAGYLLTKYYAMRDSVTVNNNLMTTDKMEQVSHIKYQNRDYAFRMAKQKRYLLVAMFFVALAIIAIPLIVQLIAKNRKLRESHSKLYERFKEKLETDENGAPAQTKRNDFIDHDTAARLGCKVEAIMAESEEVFSMDFSLDRLAELADSKPRVLSYVINGYLGNNFYNMLNERRVKEACRRLEDDANYGHLTIEGISRSLGYKSRTTLINVFKKTVGMTPSEYQRIARQRKETTGN